MIFVYVHFLEASVRGSETNKTHKYESDFVHFSQENGRSNFDHIVVLYGSVKMILAISNSHPPSWGLMGIVPKTDLCVFYYSSEMHGTISTKLE